jgi:hypothetical protein
MRASELLQADYADLLGLSSESLQITDITGEDGTVRLSQCYDQRINRRSLPGSTAELGCSASEGQRHRIFNEAGTNELVQWGVATGASLE